MSNQSLRDCTIVVGDQEFYYMDFGPMLNGRAISSITEVTSRIQESSESTPLTIASESILSSNTTIQINETETHTIDSNEGIKFKISGARDGETYLVTAKVVLDDGAVKNLTGLLYTQSAA